jgi:N-acetylneuraminic acid mutarotase
VVPSIPTSLLADISASIKLTNGLKTVIYKDRFLIKKSWERKTATPFDWSWFYKAFVYNDKGYILELNTNEFYEYNPLTDQWNPFTSELFPGTRYNGSMYTLTGEKLFKVGGHDMGGQKFSDLWVFDFNAKTWNKKNDIPFKFLDAVSINLNSQSYVITDDGQVWKCDFINEQYTRLNDSPFNFKYGFASYFNCDGKDFVVIYGQTWQYNIQSDSWTNISVNPFTKPSYSQQSIGFSFKGTGYVLQAGQDLYKYDTNTNTWVKTSQYPGSSGNNSYKTVFVIGTKAYFAATSSNYVGGAPLMYAYQ